MRTRSHTLATVLVAAFLGLSGDRSAVAQSDQERSGARAAATEGLAAFNESRWADAIDLFRRAETLVHAPTHLLLSARAHVKLGKLVQARELYIKITKETLAPTAPQPFRDAQTEAARELAALEPRLARVTIKVQGEAKNIAVTSDGEPISSVLIGVPQPFDPGKHELKATAERMESKPAIVEVAEGGRQTVLLVLEPSATAIGAVPAGPASTAPSTGPLRQSEGPRSPETTSGAPSNGMRIAAYSALGVGAVGLASGVIFGLGAKSDYTKADDICNGPGGCPESRRSEIDDLDSSASGKKTLATVGLIVGGLGLSTGVVLLVLGGQSSRAERAAAQKIIVQPEVGRGWIGVRGSF